MQYFTHDPEAVLDYTWDWTAWLADGETIVSSLVTVAAGTVVIDSQTDDDTLVTAWVSGGSLGWSTLTCHITTTDDREDDRSIRLRVNDR